MENHLGGIYYKDKISAIIPVHVWGNAACLDELIPLCIERSIAVVEDATESLGAKYRGEMVGSLGDISCFSFNGNKAITTGGGGMIVTDNQDWAERAHYLTTQAKDDPVHYVHNAIGYNFRLTNIQAALGVAQLEQLPGFLERKREIFRQYKVALLDIEGLAIADVPDYSDNNHWMILLQIDGKAYNEDKNNLMQQLGKNRIQTRPVWALNHLQKPYLNCQSYKVEKAIELVEKSLCISSSTNLTDADIQQLLNHLEPTVNN